MAKLAESHHSGGNKVYDPCYGTGYLLTTFCKLGKYIPFGNEINCESFIIGYTRLLLSGVDDPQLNLDDALNPQKTQHDNFDVVLANPPWGSRYKGIAGQKLKDLFPIHTTDTAGLFVQHALSKLRDNGLAVLVLPEGFFYKASDRDLREELVKNHDVKAIISLPPNSIHYTSIKPNILVVRKGGSTQKIRMTNAESYFAKNKSNNLYLPENNFSRCLRAFELTPGGQDITWERSFEQIKETGQWDLTPKMMPTPIWHKLRIRDNMRTLGGCCEILTGSNIKSDDLLDRTSSEKKSSPLEITNSTEVLSVSAAETNHLIEKYLIHSCPTSYAYKFINFITFRLPPHGAMETIYKINKIFIITEKMRADLIHDRFFPGRKIFDDVAGDEVQLDGNEVERLSHYLRGNPFKKNDRFYFLSKFIKLPEKFTPVEYSNDHFYPTIGEMVGDKVLKELWKISYVRIKDIQHNRVVSPHKYLTPKASSSINEKWKLKPGDVLFSKTGTIGKTVCIESIPGNGAIASQNFYILRVNPDVIKPAYLNNFLLNSNIQEWLQANVRGVAQGTLSRSVLENLQIPVPSLSVQGEIVLGKKDIFDYLITGKYLDAIWFYFEAWSGVLYDKFPNIEKEDPLKFDYLSEITISAREMQDRIWKHFDSLRNDHNLRKKEDENYRGVIANTSLKDWITGLVEILDDLSGISEIPQGPSLINVLTDTILKLEDLKRNCIYESGIAHWVGDQWEFGSDIEDRAFEKAENLTDSFIYAFKGVIRHICADTKLNFEAKENTIRRDEMVEFIVVVGNRGIMPIRNLTVNCTVDLDRESDIQKDNHSHLDWGQARSSYLAEKQEKSFTFIGKPPKKVEEFSLSLNWKALSGDGFVIEGSQQIPLRIVDAPIVEEEFFTLKNEVLREKIPFKKQTSSILKDTFELGGSPYIAGDPVGDKKDVFFGREDLIDSIRRQVIENGNVILLEGNRRAGKTSILHYLRGSNRIPGWLSVYCSLQGAQGSRDQVGVPTEEIFREMAISISKGIAGIGIRCPLPNNTPLNPGQKLGIAKACREGIGIEAPFQDFREYLETILEILEQNNLGLLLMTDEFDKLQEGIDNHVTSPQVPENIRSLIHQYPRFSAILTGSRRLKRLREEYWSALFGLGTRESVTALKRDDAVKLITEPVQGKLIFANDAVDKVCFLTAQQPYLTQCLCTRIFDLAAQENNSSITVDVVNRAASVLIENNEHCASLWDYVRRDRRRFLLALFKKESTNPDLLRLGIIQEKLLSYNIEVRDEVLSEDLDYLQELELIKRVGRGQNCQYELEVPLMGDWIDSHQDFEALRSKAVNDMED